MATNYPTGLDTFVNPASGNTLDSPSHSLQHSDINDAVEAIETKLGVGTATPGTATAYFPLVAGTAGATSWTQLTAAGISSGTATSDQVLSADGLGGVAWTTAGVAFKNFIINGEMQVHQRGTSIASNTTGGYLTADRFTNQLSSLGTWTQSVENDAPTGSGFRKSLKMLCTTADASPAAGDYNLISQFIEGQNLQQVLKGTSSAKPLTVSFWVKSNVTGTYIAELQDVDNTRQVSATYTVSASATWERKTITFPADTTGAFDNDNALSLAVNFWLGAGSTFTSGTLNTVWASQTNANRVVGQTNVASAISNYWQVTGVQLELGSAATGFEFLPAQTELALCQRYYYRNAPANLYGNHCFAQVRSTTQVQPILPLPVTMRAIPSILEFSNLAIERAGVSSTAITAATLPTDESTFNSVKIAATTSASGASAGQVVNVVNNNSTAGYIAVSAEL